MRSTFQKTVFPNGLTLISEKVPHLNSLSMGIWVKAGTRYEDPKLRGVSHFLEHMAFKGTQKRTGYQIVQEIESVGGDFNAFTGRELTCFHVLMLAKDAGLAADILSDILLNSKFDPKEFAVEKKVILQEIAVTEDDPDELANDLFMEKIYGKNGLGAQILGTRASVGGISRNALVKYFKNRYQPQNTIIAVAGDVDHVVLKKMFGSLTHGTWGRKTVKDKKSEQPKFKKGFWWVDRETEQVHTLIGTPGYQMSDESRFAWVLLNSYLGEGMSSLLFQEIREKHGLAYTVFSNLLPYKDTGVFTIYAATNPSKAEKCIRLIMKCLKKISSDGFTDRELSQLKTNVKNALMLGNDTVETRMQGMARYEIYFGKHFTTSEVCARLEDVSLQEIRDLARQIAEQPKSLLMLGPKPKKKVKEKFAKLAAEL